MRDTGQKRDKRHNLSAPKSGGEVRDGRDTPPLGGVTAVTSRRWGRSVTGAQQIRKQKGRGGLNLYRLPEKTVLEVNFLCG